MMVIGLMMSHMDSEKKIGEMEIFTKEILKLGLKRAKEHIYGLMDLVTMGVG